jgi:two-component system, chemotaxis family, protein-glutamate methylesterase/glutaminase
VTSEDPIEPRPAQREAVAIGASAGGVEALTKVISGLPPELPAAVFVVLHLPPTAYSVLPSILARSGALPVTAALDAERFQRGHVYVAPPDSHMLVVDDHIRLSRGPRENGHRPAIDPLFRSVARAFGAHAIGVVLSGTLDDGTAGLRFLKGRGGAAIVQDPDEALYGGMPASAIEHVPVDRVATADDLADAICTMIDEPLEGRHVANPGPPVTDPMSRSEPPDLVALPPDDDEITQGDPTTLTCPDCGGVLNAHEDGELIRFGCQVGHSYSPESLVNGQAEALESALWAAIRALEERSDLFRRMARRAGGETTRMRLEDRAAKLDREARSVKQIASQLGGESARR